MPDGITFEDFTTYYRTVFVPAYSDLTGYLLYKPIPVLHSIENSFSHLMQYHNLSLNTELRTANIEKAYHHLERATLDCYKMLFVEIDKKITPIAYDHEHRKFCINTSEVEFLTKYNGFKTRIREIRVRELQNVGINIEETIALYQEAVSIGFSLIGVVDGQKLSDYDNLKRRETLKKTARDFIIGLITGLIAAIIYGYWSTIVTYFH